MYRLQLERIVINIGWVLFKNNFFTIHYKAYNAQNTFNSKASYLERIYNIYYNKT